MAVSDASALPGMGQPDQLRRLADQLLSLPDRIEAGEVDHLELRKIARVAAMHLGAAATRGEKRDNAVVRATSQAETKIRMAMAAMQVASIEDGTAFDTRGFFVYGLWGKGEPETPLYVGLSTNILARLGAHLGDKYKRPYIKTVTLIRCGSYLRAVECEKRLIDLYQPPWNVRGCEARGYGGVASGL